ncbi:ribonuclease H-like domain, reverse transcriptase, RNA-dependent DNA polymerase, partial [Tanacetum coccineum]
YAIYKRSDNGRTVMKQGAELDGGYVVPYNPTLLKRYQAHINVEWCNQFGSIKYLFKYINKGPDRVTAAVEYEETDEIKDYYDFERLPFHLPNQQSVMFDPSESIDYQLEKKSVNTSKFLAWIEINKTDIEAQKLLYVKPSEGSITFLLFKASFFYLRRLLNHVRGAQEWEDFRTYDNAVYPTCKDACYARGLLDDDKEYVDGIIKASQWGLGDYLRNYFVMLVLSDTMSRPEIVWEKTWRLLAEDVLELERRKQNNPDLQLTDIQRYNICLTCIEDKILSCSKSLKNIVNMPYPNAEFTMEGYNRLIYDESDYKIPELIIQHEALHRSLTNEQKGIYETILDACNNNTGGMFFVYGYGGTGKTFLYKILTAALRETKLIIWDEAPMINKLTCEAFDRTLRDICFVNSSQSSDNVFGGKVVVFGGYFHQILPVIPNGSRQEVVHASLNMSYLWKHCTVLKLTQNMRLRVGCNPNDAEEINEFAELILNIGEGKAGGKNDGHAEVEFPEEMLIPNLDDHVESVIKETYDNWEEKLWDPTYF